MFLPGVAIALLVFGSGTTRAIGIGLRCWQSPLGDDGGNAFDCSCLGNFALAGRYLGYATIAFSHEEPSSVGIRVARLNGQTGPREDASVDFDGTSTTKKC